MFKEILEKKMLEKNLTIKELSEKSGLSIVCIQNLINGLNLPSVLTLGKLSKALDCDYDELYDSLKK